MRGGEPRLRSARSTVASDDGVLVFGDGHRVPALYGPRRAHDRVEHHRELHGGHWPARAARGPFEQRALSPDVVTVRAWIPVTLDLERQGRTLLHQLCEPAIHVVDPVPQVVDAARDDRPLLGHRYAVVRGGGANELHAAQLVHQAAELVEGED